jgi:hypothetical protein
MDMRRLVRKSFQWASIKWLTSYRLNAIRTRVSEVTRRRGASQLAFILGCQRSGTTMMAQAIGLSPLIKDYGEGAPKYFQWDGAPRLRPLDEVALLLANERNPIVLLKPLCESQRADELLNRFPGSKAIWIYRDYRDCVESHVRYYRQFHDGLAYVREMLNLQASCWKNENLSETVKRFLKQASARPLSIESAYALYWFARNSLVDQVQRDRVMLVRYEDVLANPDERLRSVFKFLSINYHTKYSRIVSTPSAKRRPSIQDRIDPDVNEHCRELLDHLHRLSCTDHLTPHCSIGPERHA